MHGRKALIEKLLLPLFLLAAILPAHAEEHLKKHIKGSLKHDVYTSQLKDFRLAVPVYETLGGAVRDEFGQPGEMEIEQVVFTDDFGGFYRVLSFKTSRPMEGLLKFFQDIRDQQEIQTARGREFRVIDLEKEGAEFTVTTIANGSSETITPDMVTANAIFAANGRYYQLVAGFPVYKNSRLEDRIAEARKRLDALLDKFEILEAGKPVR